MSLDNCPTRTMLWPWRQCTTTTVARRHHFPPALPVHVRASSVPAPLPLSAAHAATTIMALDFTAPPSEGGRIGTRSRKKEGSICMGLWRMNRSIGLILTASLLVPLLFTSSNKAWSIRGIPKRGDGCLVQHGLRPLEDNGMHPARASRVRKLCGINVQNGTLGQFCRYGRNMSLGTTSGPTKRITRIERLGFVARITQLLCLMHRGSASDMDSPLR